MTYEGYSRTIRFLKGDIVEHRSGRWRDTVNEIDCNGNLIFRDMTYPENDFILVKKKEKPL